MPISPTSEKDTLRVSFSPQGEGESPHRYESEIVCFLRVTDAGLDIAYSHHVYHTREATVGPFTNETSRRMPLTPALIAVIEQGVFYEFWASFNRGVRTSPKEIDQVPEPRPM